MSAIKVYFSDYFNVDEDIIDRYGAVNILLINHYSLFIAPFLLFNSRNTEFRRIHQEMIGFKCEMPIIDVQAHNMLII